MSLVDIFVVVFWWIIEIARAVDSYMKGLLFAIVGFAVAAVVVFVVGAPISVVAGVLLYFLGMAFAYKVYHTPGTPSPQSEIASLLAGYMIGWLSSMIVKLFM